MPWLRPHKRFGHGRRRLATWEVEAVLRLHGSGLSLREIARRTGVHRQTVARLLEQQRTVEEWKEHLAQRALAELRQRRKGWLEALVHWRAEALGEELVERVLAQWSGLRQRRQDQRGAKEE